MGDNRTEKRKIGDLGEEIACRFLMKRGFRVIMRNYLKKWGEIDIIARKGKSLYFFEVKTVSCENLHEVSHETVRFSVAENIHTCKLKRLSRAIESYLSEFVTHETDWQLDGLLVFLDLDQNESRVERIENINI